MPVPFLGKQFGDERRGVAGGAIFGGEAQADLAASPEEIGKSVHGAMENGHGASFREVTILEYRAVRGAGAERTAHPKGWGRVAPAGQ